MGVTDLGEGPGEPGAPLILKKNWQGKQNKTAPFPLAQGLDLPLDGQTGWAKSFLQIVVSSPGVQSIMKPLAIPLIVIYLVDSVAYLVNSGGQYVLKTYSTSIILAFKKIFDTFL